MSKTSSGGGMGALTMVILVIIKATGSGLYNWSWFAVISSIVWAPVVLIIFLMLMSAFFVAFSAMGKKQDERDNRK